MENRVVINLLPFTRPNGKYLDASEWDVRSKLLKQDLSSAKVWFENTLMHHIPSIDEEIILNLSINVSTFKIKKEFDTKMTKNAVNLVKSHLKDLRETKS